MLKRIHLSISNQHQVIILFNGLYYYRQLLYIKTYFLLDIEMENNTNKSDSGINGKFLE